MVDVIIENEKQIQTEIQAMGNVTDISKKDISTINTSNKSSATKHNVEIISLVYSRQFMKDSRNCMNLIKKFNCYMMNLNNHKR